MGDAPLTEVTVVKVSPYLSANRPLLWLCEKATHCPRLLPIAIGQFEAVAIQMQLNQEHPPRPISYDLLTSMLNSLDVVVRQIVIHTVRRQTFYAKIVIEKDRQIKEIDSRPSDAVALALRTDSPIYISQKLLEQAGFESLEDEADVERTIARFYEIEPQITQPERREAKTASPGQTAPAALPKKSAPTSTKEREETVTRTLKSGEEPIAEPAREEDELSKLQARLERAVLYEEYETAARLRDEIELLLNKSKT